MHPRPVLFAAGSYVAVTLCAASAAAQTVSPILNPYFPDRIVNGQVQTNLRPQNLTPEGINYTDCVEDMSLRFSVSLSGFTGAQNMQIWATVAGDCTQNIDRGAAGSAAATCWLVSEGLTGPIIATPTSYQFTIRVQDLIGPQNHPPFPATLVNDQTVAACSQQPSFIGVPINIYFVPLDTTQTLSGTAWEYTLYTDTVGPPAPTGVSDSVGDSLFNVTWTANADADTTGYDVFIDPIPGQPAGQTSLPLPEPTLVCPDTGATQPTDASLADGSLDAQDEAGATDAASSTLPQAGACYFITVSSPGATGGTNGCSDPLLAQGIVQDSGAAVVTTVDEAGDDSGSIVSGVGGISTIPTANLVGVSSATLETVADKSAGQFNITGLQNGALYTVVVAAVDGYGNVGPPSTEVCDTPSPTQDFFKTYKSDGGGAGGGFCALDAAGAPVPSLAGAGLVVSLAALLRRRKRSGR